MTTNTSFRTPTEERTALVRAMNAVVTGKGRREIPAADYRSLIALECLRCEERSHGAQPAMWLTNDGWDFLAELESAS